MKKDKKYENLLNYMTKDQLANSVQHDLKESVKPINNKRIYDIVTDLILGSIHINLEEDRAYKIVDIKYDSCLAINIYTLVPIESGKYEYWDLGGSHQTLYRANIYPWETIIITKNLLNKKFIEYNDTFKLLYGSRDDRFIEMDNSGQENIVNKRNDNQSHKSLHKIYRKSQAVENPVFANFKERAKGKRFNKKHKIR